MTDRKDESRNPARAAIAVVLAVALAACNAHSSVSSTDAVPSAANVSSAAEVADPPARESDLPEIVVTARALHPGEESRIGKSPRATARRSRVPSNAPNEGG